MSRTTLDVVSVTGSRCEVSADSPSAVRDRGQREQHRHRGSQQGPERDDENHQRDRQAEHLGPVEVVPVRLLQRLLDRASADLFHPEVGVGGLDGGGRVDQRLHAVGGVLRVAGHLRADQHGRAAGGRHRRGDAGHLGPATQPPAGLARRRGRRSLVQRPGSGRDQDVLHRRVGEVGVGQHPLGPAPLADRLLRIGLRGGAGHAADRDADHDERHPAQHRPPAVLRTPSRDPYHPARAPVRHCFVLPPRHLRGRPRACPRRGPGSGRQPPVFVVGLSTPQSGGSPDRQSRPGSLRWRRYVRVGRRVTR